MLRFILWYKPTELAHSFLFCSCVRFCLYGPFNCISFHKLSRQLPAFSLCSFCLLSALLVLSTIYLFTKVSLSPDVILCGWLSLQHQPTNQPKSLCSAAMLSCKEKTQAREKRCYRKVLSSHTKAMLPSRKSMPKSNRNQFISRPYTLNYIKLFTYLHNRLFYRENW